MSDRRARATDRGCRASRDRSGPPFGIGQLRDEIQPAANLEGARGIVVLVFDPHRTAGPRVEQRMPEQRGALHVGIDSCPGGDDVLKRWGLHDAGNRPY